MLALLVVVEKLVGKKNASFSRRRVSPSSVEVGGKSSVVKNLHKSNIFILKKSQIYYAPLMIKGTEKVLNMKRTSSLRNQTTY